jgi:hypothetical protein
MLCERLLRKTTQLTKEIGNFLQVAFSKTHRHQHQKQDHQKQKKNQGASTIMQRMMKKKLLVTQKN